MECSKQIILFLISLSIILVFESTSAKINILSNKCSATKKLEEIIIEGNFTTHSTLKSGDVLYNFTSTKKGWEIECFKSALEGDIECHCKGEALNRIPQMLIGVHRLSIESAGLTKLRSSGLKVYANTLKDLTLTNLIEFESIQARAFDGLKNLQTIYISNAPKLIYLSRDVFYGFEGSIKTIRIENCGLVRVPDFRYLHSLGTVLHMLDLDGNSIHKISRKSVRINTEQLILDNNALTEIDESGFHGSQIAKLSFRGNKQLSAIHPTAFAGIINLQELDLSSTSIEVLPFTGLQDLEILILQNTHTLKTIPSIYNFKNLKVAWLTHSFHCCAFKYPSKHDPIRHSQRLKYLKKLKESCLKLDSEESLESQEFHEIKERSYYTKNNETANNISLFRNNPINPILLESINSDTEISVFEINNSEPPDTNEIGSFHEHVAIETGTFHENVSEIEDFHLDLNTLCGNWTTRIIEVSCYPIPDALNPCEDVMGSKWLRWSVWIVVFLAVVGNLSVLIVILGTRNDGSVPKFLMSHLGFADLCMGLYLLLLASIDVHSKKEYFNYAFVWQYGAGCKVAGFLSVFSGHLSVFTLTIITIERWRCITQAIYMNKRIQLKTANCIMTGGWIYSAVMAALPLVGLSNYSSTSICLPMEARDVSDIVYLIIIISAPFWAFLIIAICYAKIYISLGHETRKRRKYTKREIKIAKKMALLVFTNFSCWAPIAFFGLTAIANYPLIDVTKSKILLVFFYPLNSCADPILYAIITSQYRKDFFTFLSRFGLCKKNALKYKENFSVSSSNVYQQAERNVNTIRVYDSAHNPEDFELMLRNSEI